MQDGGYGRRGPFPTGAIISRIPHNRGRRRGRRTRIGRRHSGKSGRRHSGKGGGLGGTMQHSRGTNIKSRGQSLGDGNKGGLGDGKEGNISRRSCPRMQDR